VGSRARGLLFLEPMYDHKDNDGPDVPRMTEAEAEKLHERHERLINRVQARFRRERAERLREIFREELARMQAEEGPDGGGFAWEIRAVTEDELHEDGDEEGVAESKAAPAEHRLVTATRELSETFMKEFTSRSLIPRGSSPEHPLVQLGASTFKASLKLAAALDPAAFPPPPPLIAIGIVHLKRAQAHLEDACAALDDAQEQQLLETKWCVELRATLVQYITDVRAIVAELREKLS
jgi:hypothetical protein